MVCLSASLLIILPFLSGDFRAAAKRESRKKLSV
jgi:hypothetical protein